ncbi:keto-deoxy-phosphogluconate aldolase [Terasakiispira papahanaumokuakeensis]|uniref:2-dehydro-3-deoxy-phosphogluconate aldolase n=1 Tax=Terasakiispira papahanaumokuakeensis TaxID=197479 RepID=A0A1E2V7X1_9GAMM|nr:bifunctional 4-hydroxy-2-oxoglutarate aldolase/2-dehydro-3-deoxy-phosphogluconate aldolase [Terasakiispira papahanaumokuakeensis]ODC03013.1 keto-deoxy-phosphogluconate aldolase [Terasakiispira papahanaumokuakeensis]
MHAANLVAHTQSLDHLLQMGPVIPVLTIERLEDAEPIGQALYDGGIRVLEVTLRTECALEVIGLLRQALPDIYLGAGTVLTPEQFQQAEAVGADFVVTPGTTEALYDYGQQSHIPLLPGIATASELMHGWSKGYRRFKFFPAEASGGVAMLKALAGPFPEAIFCPTGGIGTEQLAQYLSLPNVPCVGGSWLTPKDHLQAKDWGAIQLLAEQTLAVYSTAKRFSS